MRRCSASDIVLKVLGLLLLTAAVLKGHELLTVPVLGGDLWSWRPFLIFQVEFELTLGIWLLSGVFRRLAWLAALACFSLFCCVTLYKGLTGAASCGCFGRVHINPWITLLAIDLPVVATLSIFHPIGVSVPFVSFLRRQESVRDGVRNSLRPVMAPSRCWLTAGFTLVVLTATTPILALNKPVLITSTYEVLDPETWIGKELPILDYIDIGEQLKTGTWLLLFYHHGCPHCREVIPQYERIAQDLAGNEEFLRICLIQVPPYGSTSGRRSSDYLYGYLANAKEWFITTPAVILMAEGEVKTTWKAKALPDFQAVVSETMACGERTASVQDCHQ